MAAYLEFRWSFAGPGRGVFPFDIPRDAMCGIVGFLSRRQSPRNPLGGAIYRMLNALGCRGPDSAGVALYSHGNNGGLVLRVKLGEGMPAPELQARADQICEKVRSLTKLQASTVQGEYLRLVVGHTGNPATLEQLIESAGKGVEVVSMGKKLEIIKQVGSPRNLDETYGISKFAGTHGIGHTRLSTESRVDLSHSQPFWAHGRPDLAVVHNGHITNYHKLRRQYEQRGVRFYTENDSEIIGVYLKGRLSERMSLEEAMKASLVDLDGSFSFLVVTADALGFAKDPFAFKPLLFAETEAFVAMATEEIAIRAALTGKYTVREAQAKEVRLWLR